MYLADKAMNFWQFRQLSWEMTKRELTERYAGQILGAIWVIGHPLFLMAIYVTVFTYAFSVKAGGTYELPLEYSVYLMSGLVPWLAYSESLSKSSNVIIANSGLVKQSVFPLEVLSLKGVLVSVIIQSVGLAIVLSYVFMKYGALAWTTLLIPPLLFVQVLGMLGFSLLLAAVGVYFRDLKDIVQVLLVANMYIIPIFYLPSMVPGAFRFVLGINPFSHMIYCWHDILYFGRIEHPYSWLIFCVGSLALLVVGLKVFDRLKPMFGSAL